VDSEQLPDLGFEVTLEDVDAQHLDRPLEIPMDFHAGKVDGKVSVRCHSEETWEFPEFYGRASVHDLSFHFWDATVDRVFEGDQNRSGNKTALHIYILHSHNMLSIVEKMIEKKRRQDKTATYYTYTYAGRKT
jgi:hypothetical protein